MLKVFLLLPLLIIILLIRKLSRYEKYVSLIWGLNICLSDLNPKSATMNGA